MSYYEAETTKNWGGLELPGHLDYEGAVKHVLDNLECAHGLVKAPFDREGTETILRAWGLRAGMEVLLVGMTGKPEWYDLFMRQVSLSRLGVSRYR